MCYLYGQIGARLSDEGLYEVPCELIDKQRDHKSRAAARYENPLLDGSEVNALLRNGDSSLGRVFSELIPRLAYYRHH